MTRLLKTELQIACLSVLVLCVGCAPSGPAKVTHYANLVSRFIENDKLDDDDLTKQMRIQQDALEHDPEAFEAFVVYFEEAILADEKAKLKLYAMFQSWKAKRSSGSSSSAPADPNALPAPGAPAGP